MEHLLIFTMQELFPVRWFFANFNSNIYDTQVLRQKPAHFNEYSGFVLLTLQNLFYFRALFLFFDKHLKILDKNNW